MKKQKTFAMLFLALLVLWNVCQALIIPPTGDGQIGLEAVVLCEKLTIRQEPRSNSKAVQTLPYGYVYKSRKTGGQTASLQTHVMREEQAGSTQTISSSILPGTKQISQRRSMPGMIQRPPKLPC